MTFDPTLAMVRFGTGLSPRFARPAGVDSMLDELRGADDMATQYPIASFAATTPSHAVLSWINRAARDARGTQYETAAQETRRLLRQQIPTARYQQHLATIARAVEAPTGLRERLMWFWTDHFTVARKSSETPHLIATSENRQIACHLFD